MGANIDKNGISNLLADADQMREKWVAHCAWRYIHMYVVLAVICAGHKSIGVCSNAGTFVFHSDFRRTISCWWIFIPISAPYVLEDDIAVHLFIAAAARASVRWNKPGAIMHPVDVCIRGSRDSANHETLNFISCLSNYNDLKHRNF